jgi:hypothetical protein
MTTRLCFGPQKRCPSYSQNDALEEPRQDYDLTWSLIVRRENRSRYI